MVAMLLTLLTGLAAPTMNRFYVVDASAFGDKAGFYIDFENDAQDGKTCQIENLKPYLGVADGKGWRFVSVGTPFKVGQTLHITAQITPSGSKLSINGQTVESPGGFKPAGPSLSAASVPNWANGPTLYRLVEKSLTVTVNDVPHVSQFPASVTSPVLSLFESQLPVIGSLQVSAGDKINIDATLEIQPLVDLNAFKPVLDIYGQVRQAIFPEKILSETQLKAAFQADDHQLATWKPRTDVDEFGGQKNVSWAEKGTGFYKTVKRNGFWWLQTPKGNPVFYTGVCTAPSPEWDSTPVTGRLDLFTELPARDATNPSLWERNVWGTQNTEQVAVHGLNLIKRFGATNVHERTRLEAQQRLAAWGFSGFGKWCQDVPGTPILQVVPLPGIPRIDRHFDVFDAKIVTQIQTTLDGILGPNVKNPYILGYSFGNEYDEIITPSEIVNILASKTGSPAKSAFLAYATKNLYEGSSDKVRQAWGVHNVDDLTTQPLTATTQDVESLRRMYASRYYKTLYTAFKTADPNHLYFGFWIVPDWWVSDEDWNLIAPNVDVIGFDRYSDWPGIEKLLARFDKPVLLGEFSFPAWYGGARGFGRFSIFTETDAESGSRYAKLLGDASKCPQCVGTMWFQYRDEPITGRGPATDGSVAAGEHYAFGLIDATDLPKYDLVRPVRLANLAANGNRLRVTQ